MLKATQTPTCTNRSVVLALRCRIAKYMKDREARRDRAYMMRLE